MSSTTVVVGISVPKALIKKIDLERGLVSRSKYIVRGLELGYGYSSSKGRIRNETSEVTLNATRMTEILNKHMDEPDCKHTVKEIVKEIFE